MKTKSNQTHTPGPWEYRKTADTFHTGHPVFGVGPKINGAIVFVAEQIYEADAQLIAAAPDLLEAAKKLVESIDSDEDGEMSYDGAFLIQLRAACDKAEGK